MGESEPDKKRSLEKQTTTATRSRIQLLLHCVDGCVPYLNPQQLEQHFPPSETDLWLGLAVRDSCVIPIFNNTSSISDTTEGEEKKSKRKNKKKNQQQQQQPSDDTTTTTSSTKSKVRGYTFAASRPDPWLLPYKRLTVPSFDLRHTDQIYDKGAKNTNKGNNNSNGNSTSKNTNNSVLVWTPHGRQKLTADLYATASLEGLQSQHTVSLFDDVDEEGFSIKRKQKAETRNQQWFQDLSSRQHDSTVSGDSSSSFLWKPILLPHQGEKGVDLNDESRKTLASSSNVDVVIEGTNNKTEHVPSGVAFVGRWSPGVQLNKMISKDSATTNTHLDRIQWKAILTTYSLPEILDIASTGIVNVIGTNLPQKWAKEKLALGLDLSMDEPLSDIPTTGRDPKRQKTEIAETTTDNTSKENGTIPEKTPSLNADGCMDLSDKTYARNPKPLVVGCKCFVCKDNRFSRAYIHHLVVAKEMVAEILIFGHNLHCLLELLQKFDCDEINRKKVNDYILRQLGSCQSK